VGQPARQRLEGQLVTADALGELGALGLSAVGDQHRVAALRQAGGGHAAHLAGADHQRRAPLEVADGPIGGAQTDVNHGRRPRRDGRLGAHPLAHAQRLARHPPQQPRAGALGGGVGDGLLDLQLDLALASHHRVQPGGHRKEVGGGAILVVVDQRVDEVLRWPSRPIGEEGAQVGEPAVVAGHVRVDLHAVARRQHHRLGDVLARGQIGQRFGQLIAGHRELVEKLDGRGAIAQPEGEDRHDRATSLARGRSPVLK
jgi:hypothetical protein